VTVAKIVVKDHKHSEHPTSHEQFQAENGWKAQAENEECPAQGTGILDADAPIRQRTPWFMHDIFISGVGLVRDVELEEMEPEPAHSACQG